MKLIARFATDAGYREGWLAGEAEGKRLQARSQTAGVAAGAAYPGYRVGQEDGKARPRPHNVANEVFMSVNTDALKSLEQ